MAHILIATDFSTDAMHAAEYAVELFGRTGNTYLLLNTCYALPTADPAMPTMTGQLMEAAEEALKDFRLRFVRRTGAQGVESEVAYGLLPGVVNELARTKGMQVVVCGNRGRTGTALFGSNAVSLIKGSLVPVLAVPLAAPLQPADRILFATDQEDLLPRHIELLRLVATLGQAEVLIAHVDIEAPKGGVAALEAIIGQALKGIPHSFHEVYGLDVVDGLQRFAKHRHVDMMAVLHRHIGFVGRLFSPSTAKGLAHLADRPLLVMQDVD